MTKTYFLDIDGVLLKHNGNLSNQINSSEILSETYKLLNNIELDGGRIILTTGRKESMRNQTETILSNLGIFYDYLVMGCNRGARILVNDMKPDSNLKTAYAFSPKRNELDALELEKILTPCEERPWGNFATLAYNKKYHIKEIQVNPGCASSLQSHKHRDELWLVLEGNGEYVLDEKTYQIEKNSICVIKKEQKHRIKNTGTDPLVFIEIQTGDKFSESDITRYNDHYGRC